MFLWLASSMKTSLASSSLSGTRVLLHQVPSLGKSSNLWLLEGTTDLTRQGLKRRSPFETTVAGRLPRKDVSWKGFQMGMLGIRCQNIGFEDRYPPSVVFDKGFLGLHRGLGVLTYVHSRSEASTITLRISSYVH